MENKGSRWNSAAQMQIKIRLTHGQTETSTAVAVLAKTFWGGRAPVRRVGGNNK